MFGIDLGLWDDVIKAILILMSTGFIGWLGKQVWNIGKTLKGYVDTQNIMSNALRDILKTMIVAEFEIASKNGYVTNIKFEIIDKMFKSYSDLGGNGYIKDIYERIKKLPRRNIDLKSL